MVLFKFCVLPVVVLRLVLGKITDLEYASMPSLFHLDDFDRCMVFEKTALYCSITVQLAPINLKNHSDVWKVISEIISHKTNYRHDQLRQGICVPESCPQLTNNILSYKKNNELLKNAISECYSEKYKNLGLQGFVTDLHCETSKPFYSVDIYDVLVGIFLIVLFTSVVFASICGGFLRHTTKKNDKDITFPKLVLCFSLPKNWKRLRSEDTSSNGNYLRCVNGIRFYNIILVITLHVGLYGIVTPTSNPQFYENIAEHSISAPILSGGSYLVQTFFLIAGLLLSYHFFLIFERHKEVKFRDIFISFINRYIRLTPSLMVMVAINGTWLYHLGRGPFWDKRIGIEYRNCRENWWTNLLYINNYYNSTRMCLQYTWYLAADTQLYLLSLIIISLMWKYQQHIKIILSTSLLVGIFLLGITNYFYDYERVIRAYPGSMDNVMLDLPQWHNIYSSGYTNIGAYTIGLIFGYLFYTYREEKVFTKKRYVMVWWILTIGLPLSIIFTGVPIYSENYERSRFGTAIYVSLARNIFVLGIAIGMFGISQGVGWFFRDTVIWSPLQILGRLTYCVYLVNLPLICIRIGQVRAPNYMSYYSLFTQISEDVIVSYMFALLLHLFVEMPFSALQKLLVPQLETKRKCVLKQPTVDIVEHEPTTDIHEDIKL